MRVLSLVFVTVLAACQSTTAVAVPFLPQPGNVLEIHQINVQQGDCTLIIGPNGTTFLIDAGNVSKGSGEVAPYLASIGIQPADGLDFMLCTHRDSDHLGSTKSSRLATTSTTTGSESSTNCDYMNMLTLTVAVINIGPGQGGNFHHPRSDVVENVLMDQVDCIVGVRQLLAKK
jgi:beta-lactamase superfamily II metal-dependent hydrolase